MRRLAAKLPEHVIPIEIAELGSVGIRGSLRRRILAETADHLQESGDAAAFGEPSVIAGRFADELAMSGARRVAFTALIAYDGARHAHPRVHGLTVPADSARLQTVVSYNVPHGARPDGCFVRVFSSRFARSGETITDAYASAMSDIAAAMKPMRFP